MVLEELLGRNARIKILEEFLTYFDSFLSVEEISRMSDIPSKTVKTHLKELENIGILEVENKEERRFRLNQKDQRALALGLIETSEYLKQL